ncbi:SDR family NAD(P)-dependent oxidoreductase [Streptomyces sp. cmx-4-9]|uniref:SDR family NAD(P)-dependent oxidoreductase n=1 Tax=Streptomyces sp. cmx-4-9 TaxID=2790941 RepID=UPI00397F2F48
MTGIAPDLTGRTVVVTGGGHGLGAVIGEAFADAGANVVLTWCRSKERAERTRADLADRGHKIDLVRANVADRDSVRELFTTVAEHHQRLDVLINNAASGAFTLLADLRDKDLNRAIDTDYKGTWWCSQEALPLLATTRGNIINLTAPTATTSHLGGIAPAKAAVESLTRYLAAEYGPRGVRANCLAPGLLTGERARTLPDFARRQAATAAATPLRGIGDPAAVAAAALFLASPAARWITGHTLVVDGGYSIRPDHPLPEDMP